jgi:hypothetical protein
MINIFKNNFMFIFSVAFLMTFATTNIIYDMHTDENWDEIIAVSQGVLTGYPPWRAFQNRLLMPIIISLLEGLSNPKNEILFVYCVGIFIHNILLVAIFSKLFGRFCSILAVLLWCFGFILYQDYYLYPWDIFDLSLFLIVWFVLYTSSNVNLLIIIFPLALLNRESALFLPIAYWLVQTSFDNININTVWSKIFSQTTLITITLLLVGIFWTKFIRDYFFIGSSSGGFDLENYLIGNHIYFSKNLFNMFFNNWISDVLPINLITIFYLIFVIKSIWRSDTIMPKIASTFWIILLVNILVFGVFNETRMHFILLGFYLFHNISFIQNSYMRK